MNKAAQAYFQTKVNTTDQGQLLLLLYDGALKFLQQARDKMEEKDYAAKGVLISKVIDIINELTNTLNLEKGGSLAENLNNLYFLCTTRLLQANLKMNVEQLDSVATILSGLRSAYAEIIETPEARQASAQIASRLNVDASVGQRAAIQTHHAPMPMSNVGMMQARNAYGAMQRSTPAPAPVSGVGAPAAPKAAPTSGIAAGMAGTTAAATAPAADSAAAATGTAGAQRLPFTPAQVGQPVQAGQAGVAQSASGQSQQTMAAAPVAPTNPASAQATPSATPPATTQSTQAAPQTAQAASPAAQPAQQTAQAAAPRAGFGVKGFAYNKAFGK